ncbi:alpha/beta fold hydrolase [Nocardioides albidus]|uniref:Alpha/beta fold hydrolase n=1 Tax=Nocardioides albidus TaxID=1517589 RepID=A0A5C4WFT7_9ACTN|nr:alpha/beta fold hydrolase [Nocardioides albidus]TNM46149.1 alpha/beta fold hydrolase [Nocardioides albidus]
MGEPITSVVRDGLTFDVYDEGPADAEPILLLHGFPERSTCWRHVAPLLHKAGYRTVAMDQRGYSPGARPSRRRDYRAEELLGDALALADAVGGRVHVVGHDWGAIPAWLLAAHHPERVASLTAVSVPHPAAFLAAMVRSPQLLHSWYMAAFQVPLVPERLLGSGGRIADRMVSSFGMREDDVRRFRAEIVDAGILPTALNWYRALPLAGPGLLRRKVTVPTTMVWSDQDVAVERWGPEHTDRWVDAPFRFVPLEGVSHWIPTHAPDALAEAILDRVRSA